MVTIITVEEMVTAQNTQSEIFFCIFIYNTTLDFSSTGFEKLVNRKIVCTLHCCQSPTITTRYQEQGTIPSHRREMTEGHYNF